MAVAFIIWSIIATLFFVVGFSCRKSKNAVGFFTFSKPPVIEDIKGYNQAVSVLWFVFATIYEIIGVSLFFIEQNSPVVFLLILAVFIWVILLIFAYLRIEAKYKKK